MFIVIRTNEFNTQVGYIISRHRSIVSARKSAMKCLEGAYHSEVEIYDNTKAHPGSVGELVGVVRDKPIYGGVTWHSTDKDGKKARWLLRKNGELGERQL